MKNLISLSLAMILVGCSVPLSRSVEVDPFEIEFGGQAAWTEGYSRFDPNLPGYHVTGDIASMVLRPRSKQVPDKMVIAITTSPGMRPMLEHFKVTTKEITLTSALFNGTGSTGVTNRRTKTQATVKRGKYLRFSVVGREVRVTFLPEAMGLLEGDIKVSWIDWYRQ